MKKSMMSRILSFVLSQADDVKESRALSSNELSKPRSWQEIDDEYKSELLDNYDDDNYEPALHIDDIVFV